MASFPQRGAKPLDYKLVYDSRIWYLNAGTTWALNLSPTPLWGVAIYQLSGRWYHRPRMPRKRPKTAADRPTYRPPSMPSIGVPEELQPFLVAMATRHVVEQYGLDNVQVVLGAMIAERARRELIDRRTSAVRQVDRMMISGPKIQ